MPGEDFHLSGQVRSQAHCGASQTRLTAICDRGAEGWEGSFQGEEL